jgi:8-oxo-dGTP pyrophosphatase MutT (NUDIX family)
MMIPSLAEQIALWADKLRDLSAAGLCYASSIYDRERYQALQDVALEMLAVATAQDQAMLEPLRTNVFARMCPVVGGNAAVIRATGHILLLRRADTQQWVMPGGMIEVGETPAEAVVRETREETGVVCLPVALVGVYDSRRWDSGLAQQVYKFTFLCQPGLTQPVDWPPSHAIETLETGWFREDRMPEELYEGHRQRIADAFRVWRGDVRAHFDP